MTSGVEVLTVGHSVHDVDTFVGLLQKCGVTAVADVRSSPYSQFSPQFNREGLEEELGRRGIKYVFLGRELGARSDDPTCYADGRVQYGRLARTDLFASGIQRVLEGADRERIGLMCTEKDPLDCHRTILVARVLAEEGASVSHIHADGSLEPHRDAMLRLLDRFKMPHAELFRSTEQVIEEALDRQEERIAYVPAAPRDAG